MQLALLLAALAVVSAPVRAADKPLSLNGGPKAEDALRKFVSQNPKLKAKLDGAAQREEAFLAESRDPDLRDAVSDAGGPDELKKRLAQASAADRAQLLDQLPGVKGPVGSACAALADCAHPDLARDVSDPDQLPDAVRDLVRPWMLLQQARGRAVELAPVAGDGDAALSVTLKGADAAPLILNVSPRLLGGFKVWFDQPLTVASLYGRERDAALKPAR